jgi:hypothetical protein
VVLTVSTYISEEVEIKVFFVETSVSLASDDLENQHAEAVDVGLHGKHAIHRILWGHVAAENQNS